MSTGGAPHVDIFRTLELNAAEGRSTGIKINE